MGISVSPITSLASRINQTRFSPPSDRRIRRARLLDATTCICKVHCWLPPHRPPPGPSQCELLATTPPCHIQRRSRTSRPIISIRSAEKRADTSDLDGSFERHWLGRIARLGSADISYADTVLDNIWHSHGAVISQCPLFVLINTTIRHDASIGTFCAALAVLTPSRTNPHPYTLTTRTPWTLQTPKP
jgi:hypothetical protein